MVVRCLPDILCWALSSSRPVLGSATSHRAGPHQYNMRGVSLEDDDSVNGALDQLLTSRLRDVFVDARQELF